MSKSDKRSKIVMLCLFVLVFSLSGYAVAAPLHEAAKEGDLPKVNSLIEGGADVNVRTGNGATPLHFAADRGHIDVVELLISKGANVNANNFWETPMAWAGMVTLHTDTPEVLKRRKEIIDLLRSHGGK